MTISTNNKKRSESGINWQTLAYDTRIKPPQPS